MRRVLISLFATVVGLMQLADKKTVVSRIAPLSRALAFLKTDLFTRGAVGARSRHAGGCPSGLSSAVRMWSRHAPSICR